MTGQRIKMVREAKGLSRAAFAESLGVGVRYIGFLECGDKAPSSTLVNLLLTLYNVNTDWWETGEGEMFIEKKAPTEVEALTDYEREVIRVMNQLPEDYQAEVVQDLHTKFLEYLKKKREQA